MGDEIDDRRRRLGSSATPCSVVATEVAVSITLTERGTTMLAALQDGRFVDLARQKAYVIRKWLG